ncbi:MAG: PCRF domain-containing protein, partial [Clostridiales bacterium]|nr:PCRF domain-containing protein [Clostridiales bacterium]
MFEKLRQLEQRYSLIQARLNQPETYGDAALVAKLNRELRELEELVTAYRAWQRCQETMEQSEELSHDPDPELRALAAEEYQSAKEESQRLERELQILLLPKDPNDDKNVIVEIRAGVGGEEAALFAHSLYRMYGMYGDRRGWSQEVANASLTELGGVKEITFTVSGEGVYARMKYESGVHRVQRVPET